jgi:penicillin-binding protein 2
VQIAQLISVIASEGKSYQPQIVDKIVSPDGEIVKEIPEKINIDLREEVSEKTFKALKQGMYDVVNKEYGTAHRHFRDYPLDIAGKTGTAQTSTALNNHAWFGGFAPFDEPEIAVVVLLENGGSSAYSVPIAKEIIDYYFGFKNLNNGSKKIYYYDNE